MTNWIDYLLYFSLSWLIFSIPLFIVIFAFFGRLMKLQFKYWVLAKRGYHKVEHIGEDRVVRTYFIRPKDSHFDFDSGVYMLQKDALYKSSTQILKKVDTKNMDGIEDKELKELFKNVNKLKYDSESVFMQWGVPTIFYYGNDPNPVNPSDRKKIYDSKVMLAYIKRLLLEKEWKLVRMVLILTLVGFGLALVLGFLFWGGINSANNNLNTCQNMLNASQQTIANYLNVTTQAVVQNSTVII